MKANDTRLAILISHQHSYAYLLLHLCSTPFESETGKFPVNQRQYNMTSSHQTHAQKEYIVTTSVSNNVLT